MRYIFISDVHGQYDKLIKSLNDVGFDSKVDTIVSLGDPFDRGPHSYEILKFLMTCPNRILVWGNHDLRLKEILIGQDIVQSFDYSNGVLETMKSFCQNQNINSINVGIQVLKTDDVCRRRYELLWKYFNECVYAVEWSNLVGVHGWIPVTIDDKKTHFDKWGFLKSYCIYKYWENWRETNASDWYEATWSHTHTFFEQKIFLPDKKLIVGHWHAWRLRLVDSKGAIVYNSLDDIDFSTFEYEDKLVAIDGCSNADQGVVNAWVYETDEVPKFIKATE